MSRGTLSVLSLVTAAALAGVGCRDRGDEPTIAPPPWTAPPRADAGAARDRPATPDAGAAAAGDLEAGGGGGGGIAGGGVPSLSAANSPSCPDPVVGVWVAKTHADASARWHEHRLSITRDSDGELHALQTTKMWDGGPDDTLPPLCPTGGPNWGVTTILDEARFIDGILKVWGVRVLSATHTCGGTATSYSLDNFTGRLRRDAYPAVNNDGSLAVNRPYHFRRIACADQ